MVAFDLDGVFVNDLKLGNLSIEDSTLIKMRDFVFIPIFVPDKPFFIITGRPVQDKYSTERFAKKYLPNCAGVFCDNKTIGEHSSARYKATVLNEQKSIQVFVESSQEQIQIIRANLYRDVKIVWFSNLINGALWTI